MNIYFVILHYQAISETRDCINSILNNYNNVNIILVDNKSPNGSGLELLNNYLNSENIKVLLVDENLGFARGNNIGFRYAKEAGADFVIQVNNDTIFEDNSFIDTLLKLYDDEHYAVLGPDVICLKDGTHQNPLKGFEISKRSIWWRLLKNRIGYLLAYLNLDTTIKKENIYQANWKNSINISENTDKVLQGCCYIFSPEYIHMFDGTFMYYEEYILDYLCRKKNLKLYYSPALQVKHLRKAATSSVVNQDREKRMFKYKHSINSLKAFLKECL